MTVSEIVAESRKAQGLPARVEDGATLTRLTQLFQNTTTPVCAESGKTRKRASKGHLHGSTAG
jgi:hypothetical protein